MDTFNFEKLIAWEKSIEFFDLIMTKTENFYNQKSNYRLKEQLDSASASIAMNIAEGTGRSTKKDFVKFLYYSRGSLNETVTLPILLKKRNILSEEDLKLLRGKALELTKILNALITSIKSQIKVLNLSYLSIQGGQYMAHNKQKVIWKQNKLFSPFSCFEAGDSIYLLKDEIYEK